jgi:hypothetical protein
MLPRLRRMSSCQISAVHQLPPDAAPDTSRLAPDVTPCHRSSLGATPPDESLYGEIELRQRRYGARCASVRAYRMRESALCPRLWRSSLLCQLLQQQPQLRSIVIA